MADDVFISVGRPLPRIAAARLVSDRVVEISWHDGRVQAIDVTPAIVGHRHFVALRTDKPAFEDFAVGENGDCLVWASGEELSAVWLEELAPASLDNEEFRQAMSELRFSLDGMAARLGIARRLVADYRRDRPIPPAIAMATRFLVERHRRSMQFEDAI
ncbi:MAG: hypothetical protein RIC04_11165 [Parvibaculum sp.]|uniref:hypothetical protein n=1 Tax=Parvibaculum sp. TaxID=2024848 RepID=UPI0032EAA239